MSARCGNACRRVHQQRQRIESTSGPFPTTLAYDLTEDGEATILRFSVTGRPTGFMRVLQPLVARRTQQNLDAAFPRLKEVLEGGPLTASPFVL